MSFKNTLILGDSYCTFEGAIPPGYETWYSYGNAVKTDINKIEQTWWYSLFDGKENILLRNDSYSGATICNSVRPEHNPAVSFVNRLNKLIDDGFFKNNTVNTVFIFGGTNDSWTDCPLGVAQYDGFKKDDLLKVLPACGYLAKRLNEVSPGARVCWLINTDIKEEIVQGIINAARHFNQEYVRFLKIDKNNNHPTAKGMRQIADRVKKQFKIS